MGKSSLFEHQSYKSYLRSALELRAQNEKGQRSKMAKFIGCNPAYLSQILNADINLSPEQAQKTNTFLNHTPTEAKYFLNLVLLERAGTKELRLYYEAELKLLRQERLTIKNRIQSNRMLSETDQARYYSSWHFAAVHVCASLPHLRTREKIAEALKLPQARVNEALEFLTEIGLLKMRNAEFRQGEVSLHLDSKSNFIAKHHSNWRVKSLQSLDNMAEKDLHYSGVITCSEEDVLKIKDILIHAIERIRETVKSSSDETLYVYTLDLFGLLN